MRGGWTLLVDDAGPGWHNMAVDCALLDLADREARGFLRLYRWEPHCLSFGRHEPAGRRYDRRRIESRGLDCVRRPTGGRAVWHARELTYSIAAPERAFGGLRQAYFRIHEMLAAAIRALGARPELAPETPGLPPGAGPCFAACAGGEVLVEGWKVVGSAQLRQGNAFLQHGAILLEDDQSLLHDLALPSRRAAEPPSRRAAPLSRLLGRTVSFDEVAAALARSAGRAWGAELCPQSLPPEARESVIRHGERFRSAGWTWQR